MAYNVSVYAAREAEVRANYQALRGQLDSLLPAKAGKFAVLRETKIIKFCDTPDEAIAFGFEAFGGLPFSIQEVTT